MSTQSKLKQSRSQWKAKAMDRGENERYLRKENHRIKKERNGYKQQLKEAQTQVQRLNERQPNQELPGDKKSALVYVSLQLFLVARISFRAVSRVLKVLGGYLSFPQTPCPQTIINWVIRLSITRLQSSAPQIVFQRENLPVSNGMIWMIDTSIGLGSGKILAVLALDRRHHVSRESAPTLQQINCIAVSVAPSWTGETIAEFLQAVIAHTGRPAAYLKDGGTDLAKATRLLAEQGEASLSIDDISHTVANLLKHEYQEHPQFAIFLSCCGKASKNLKQTILACLAPPKVSTKARFMNLHRLVQWADQVLQHSPQGRAPKKSLLSKLRTSLNRLPECRALINRFLRDARPLLECQKILKTKGLSDKSYAECQPLIETIPARSPVRIGFTAWAEEQLEVAEKLGLKQRGMPISSDNIESLFAVAKQHGTGEIKDANRIALRIPALCGTLTEQDVQRVLKLSVKEQQKIVNTLPSLTGQRRHILPNPGSLDKTLSKEAVTKNLQLIPDSKFRGKTENKLNISDNCKNNDVPLVHIKTHEKISLEDDILGDAA